MADVKTTADDATNKNATISQEKLERIWPGHGKEYPPKTPVWVIIAYAAKDAAWDKSHPGPWNNEPEAAKARKAADAAVNQLIRLYPAAAEAAEHSSGTTISFGETGVTQSSVEASCGTKLIHEIREKIAKERAHPPHAALEIPDDLKTPEVLGASQALPTRVAAVKSKLKDDSGIA